MTNKFAKKKKRKKYDLLWFEAMKINIVIEDR